MKSIAVILFALATGAAAQPLYANGLYARQTAACAADSDCSATQGCVNEVCTTYTDCRGNGCPGGACIASTTAVGTFECSFPDAEPSAEPSSEAPAPSSAAPSAEPSASASESASAPAESSSASVSAAPEEPSASASASASAVPDAPASSAAPTPAPSADPAPAPAPAPEAPHVEEPAAEVDDSGAWRDEYRDSHRGQ